MAGNVDTIKEVAKAIRMAKTALREMTASLHEVQDSIVSLKERAANSNTLDQAIWRIWGYCWAHNGDLDSERHCSMIREMVETAIAEVAAKAESAEARAVAAERKCRELRQQRQLTEVTP